MEFFKRVINLYLYSSLHIGLGALALTYLSFTAFDLDFDWYYLMFVFCSTVFLYCLHRFIGIKKIIHFEHKGRFDVIYRYRNHILVYAAASAIGTAICVWHFDFRLVKMLIVPSIVSLLYALPILGKGKRLRDFGYIKIFLIAITWSWITVYIPLSYCSTEIDILTTTLLSIERFFFFIAITIPFDLRDKYIDQRTDLKTLVHHMSSGQARVLCYTLLVICAAILLYTYSAETISSQYLLSYLITYIISSLGIHISRDQEHDYYYTGLLDGTLLLPLLIYTLIGFWA